MSWCIHNRTCAMRPDKPWDFSLRREIDLEIIAPFRGMAKSETNSPQTFSNKKKTKR